MNFEIFRMNYFELGWALRENQIFGKRGGNKRMSEQVKQLIFYQEI